MRFIDEVPAAAVRVPTYNLAFLPRFAAMNEEEFQAFAEMKPLRKEFMLAMGRKGFPEKDMQAALGRLARTYQRMDNAIARAADHGCTAATTLADVALMPAVVRMADLNLASMWDKHPRSRDLARRHPAHPCVRQGVLLRLAADREVPASAKAIERSGVTTIACAAADR